MTTDELIARYRLLADDATEFYRFEDDQVKELLLEAEQEAAVRGRLIHESQDATICHIAVTAGTEVYPLSQLLYELTHVAFVDANGGRHAVKLVSTEALDGAREDLSRLIPPSGDDYDIDTGREDWRDSSGTVPLYAVQTDRKLRLTPTPTDDGTLALEGYRLPTRGVDDDPEISAIHHRHLVQWVIYRRFWIVDEDYFDGQRAAAALREFEQYFGARPDSDLRRITRHDTHHHVEAFFL